MSLTNVADLLKRSLAETLRSLEQLIAGLCRVHMTQAHRKLEEADKLEIDKVSHCSQQCAMRRQRMIERETFARVLEQGRDVHGYHLTPLTRELKLMPVI